MQKIGILSWFLLGGLSLGLALSGPTVGAQDGQKQPTPHPINWVQGPTLAKLGDYAEIQVPKGFLFADGNGARKYLELSHNPVSNQELGVIAPRSEQESWYIIFEFNEVGYVKDDEGSSLDSKALLESIQQGTEESNDIRKKNGWAAFHVTGWYTEPFYDQTTHNLT